MAWLKLSPTPLVYLLIFAAQCSRAMFIIIISWLALSTTGEAASVGRVLVWWPLLSLIFGPSIGVAVDHFDRGLLLTIGESIRIVGFMGLLLNVQGSGVEPIGMMSLCVAAFFVYLGALFSIPSAQALLKVVGGESLARVAVGGVLAGLSAEFLGAVAGGLSITLFGTVSSLIICTGLSVIAIALGTMLLESGRMPTRKTGPSLSAFAEALQIIVGDRRLLMSCIALTLSWATAQITLALLAGFTRFELLLGADAYGWIDSMWGVGGVGAGFALMRLSGDAIYRKLQRFGLLILAGATATFSMAQGFWTAMLLHGLFGAAFAINLVVHDAHMLTAVDAGAIGRVRNYVQAGIGAVGIAIFLSPMLLGDLSARSVYGGYSLMLAVAAMMFMVLYPRQQSNPKQPWPCIDAQASPSNLESPSPQRLSHRDTNAQ